MGASLYKEVSRFGKFEFFFVNSMNGQSSELFYLSSLNYFFPFLSVCGNGGCPNIAYTTERKMKYEFGKSSFQTCF
jgi:hypothetical protein